MADRNPLLDDRTATFLLFDVLEADALCRIPFFADHSRETFELFLQAAARLAREVVFPTYKPMDEQAASFDGQRVRTHPAMLELYPQFAELGLLGASRPEAVGGQQLPTTIALAASAYLSAANLSAYGFVMLTNGAAHLIEAFGDDALRERFMRPMYGGDFTGTMALTEPEAGSSLADIRTRARPLPSGDYAIDGAKVFISGGDQTFSTNIIHLVLARIEGSPAGTKGISLFAVPKFRLEGDRLVDNDAHPAGAFHKLGWRGIPSIALNLGENGDCRGFLVGEPNQGLSYMFQMMNEARLQVGLSAIATAAVAYQEALSYARTRPQGRLKGQRPEQPQVPIIAHADVRRMLLRQKAIVEGGLCVVLATARFEDVARHAPDAAERAHAQQMLDLLTPIAKTFCAERGFEANTLAVQIHGGYGYTSEYLPEAWLRDQKLNTIHEGTTGIQSIDLLGRKILRAGPEALAPLATELAAACKRAGEAGVDGQLAPALQAAFKRVSEVSAGLRAATEAQALSHSVDFLDMLSVVVVAWQWLRIATAAQRLLAGTPTESDRDFAAGKVQAARYWFATELPRVELLAQLCATHESSYVDMQDAWF